MKIFLSGGGTLGPVTPLIAIVDAYRRKHPFAEFIWIGTKCGPERKLVEKAGIKFIAIPSGKLRRYFSFSNFFDLFRILAAYLQSKKILKKEKPDLLISAGGFVSVPLHLAATNLKIPTWIHQQDIVPGLANRLMSKNATLITVALEKSLKSFGKKKTRWLGNPARNLNGIEKSEARKKFKIEDDEPVIFAVGGGTGAKRLNELIRESLEYLPKNWHVIHLVGIGKSADDCKDLADHYSNYLIYDFFVEEMAYAYASADIVIARGGFGTLTELSSLSKPAILVPISASHQEANVSYFSEKGAVIGFDEIKGSGMDLAQKIKKMITDLNEGVNIGEKLHDLLPSPSDETICNIIDELITK